MKQFIIISIMTVCCVAMNAQNTVTRDGDIFSISNTKKEAKFLNGKIDMFQTPFKFKDEYGESYAIYISYDGNCYICKAGKYSPGMKVVPTDITKQIHKEMGIISTEKMLRVIVVKDGNDIHIFKINSVFTSETLMTPDNHPTDFLAYIITFNSKGYKYQSKEYIKKLEILSIETANNIEDL